MNQDLQKFEELLKTDAAFQEKLKAAMENYNGEYTEKAIFEGVLSPIAEEYGITATFEELNAYIDKVRNNGTAELSLEEMEQVSGGAKTDGVGASICYKVGLGWACVDDNKCFVVGKGSGAGACMGDGQGVIW